MEGLYYKNKKEDQEAKKKINEARKKGRSTVMLETPPDYIIITLLDNKTQKFRHKDTIPEDFNLLQDDSSNKVMIQIGNISLKQMKIERTNINYKDHPLELGFAFTV